MNLSPSDFDYELPEERIPDTPAENRTDAKLLHYDGAVIHDRGFDEVVHLLPEDSQLILNNTRVIHARLFLFKPSGGRLEVFLLRPEGVSVEEAMQQKGSAKWWCLLGGAKKWKEGAIAFEHDSIRIEASRLDRFEDQFLLELNWTSSEMPFAEMVEELGKIPLPPYMQREAEESDTIRYQTTFAEAPGSVAAPTAGLHFTKSILDEMAAEKVRLTLHVSAGTFKPMSSDSIHEHTMHDEECSVSLDAIRSLSKEKTRFAVGTTSLRTLESLYWIAEKWEIEGNQPHVITQEDPYAIERRFGAYEPAMASLAKKMEAAGLATLAFSTSIMISPGYEIQSVAGIFTNFHMPKSTLLLLVATLIGDDWKTVYNHALANDYRFLSYGDSSLLFRKTNSVE